MKNDPAKELQTAMMLGQIIKDDLQKQQVTFDKNKPRLNGGEKFVAEEVQHLMQVTFNKMIEEKQRGQSLAGMDQLELKFWAPTFQCAGMLFHEYITKEYGLFPVIALSSGMVPLCRNKLWFIGVVIRKMAKGDL